MTTPTPSEDLTEAESCIFCNKGKDAGVVYFRGGYGEPGFHHHWFCLVGDLDKQIKAFETLRAISLPKGERPKPLELKAGDSTEEMLSQAISHNDALELYADQLEAKLNGGK